MLQLLFSAFVIILTTRSSHAFTIVHNNPVTATRQRQQPSSASSWAQQRVLQLWSTKLPDIENMKAGEMRHELESYGISTRSFLEKSELREAVEKARAEGKQPKKQTTTTTTRESSSSSKDADASTTGKVDSASREERIHSEMEKAKSMKVGDLKKELKALGVSTKSFFEKSEFVRAYAEAIVDGKQKRNAQQQEEVRDPSYRDVIMQKMNARDPRLLQGTIIDVTAKV